MNLETGRVPDEEMTMRGLVRQLLRIDVNRRVAEAGDRARASGEFLFRPGAVAVRTAGPSGLILQRK